MGAIVGGVVGAVAFVALLVGVCIVVACCILKQRATQRAASKHQAHLDKADNGEYAPSVEAGNAPPPAAVPAAAPPMQQPGPPPPPPLPHNMQHSGAQVAYAGPPPHMGQPSSQV